MGRASASGIVLAILGTVAVGTWAIQAQVRNGQDAPIGASPFGAPEALDVERLLETPITLPFADETPLAEVVDHLARSLKVRVLLDPAAMGRLDLFPDDVVQLAVEGTLRLRTALPLLLDQVGLTYKYASQDRLLILTDPQGAGDPQRQLLDEIRDLHRDVHDLQDLVNEMYEALMPDVGPAILKPTLIEPGNPPPPDDLKDRPAHRSRPG